MAECQERRRNAFSGTPYPSPHHPPCRPGSLCAPPGQGALSLVEGTSLAGTARGWASVCNLLCLGLCATSVCLGGCHSRPFLEGPQPPLGREHSRRDRCWGMIQAGAPPSGECFLLGARDVGLGDGRQVCVAPEPSGPAVSQSKRPQLLPLPLSDLVPACRGCSVPQGPCQPCPRCPTTCQKL